MTEDSKDPMDLSDLSALLARSGEHDFDDFILRGRIELLRKPSDCGDIYREDKDSAASAAMLTITRQLASGAPSPEAIQYVADRFTAFMNDDFESLDAAFFLKPKRHRGGQTAGEAAELEVCQAYESTLTSRTHTYDRATKTTVVGPVTDEIRVEAERMATEAHYGKSTRRLEYWEGSFRRTVRRILQKHGLIAKKK